MPWEVFGHSGSIGSLPMHNCRGAKNGIFSKGGAGTKWRKMAKIDQILKLAFLSFLCAQGTRGVQKAPWEWFLCRKDDLTTNWYSDRLLTSSSLGYFFDTGPLGGLKSVPWEVFGHSGSIGSLPMHNCRGAKNGIFWKGGAGTKWRKMAKIDQILKLAFLSFWCAQGTRRVQKTRWEWFLCRKDDLTTNWYSDRLLTSSSLGYFFDTGPLVGLKSVPWEVSGHSGSIGSLPMHNCRGAKNGIFSKGGTGTKWRKMAKIDQILKLAFLSCFCAQGTRRVQKTPWEWFLSRKDDLTTNWYSDRLLTSSSLGYFFDTDSLGGLKSVPWEVFFGHNGSIGSLPMHNCRGAKKWNFFKGGSGHKMAKNGQNWPNFEVGIFKLFLCQGTRRVQKTPWEWFLCRKDDLTTNWYSDRLLTSSSLGYFFDTGPLVGLKSVPWEVFGHSGSIGSRPMHNCRGAKNGIFSKGGAGTKWRKMAKIDQILKLVFLSFLCAQGTRRVLKTPWEWFLCRKDDLRTNWYSDRLLTSSSLGISLTLVPWED